MFVAAGLVWLQIGWRINKDCERYYAEYDERYVVTGPFWATERHERGWPFQCQVYLELFEFELTSFEQTGRPDSGPPFLVYQWRWWHLALNILVALAILAVVGVGVEWVVRRRERASNEGYGLGSVGKVSFGREF